jgi:hypothetical protein
MADFDSFERGLNELRGLGVPESDLGLVAGGPALAGAGAFSGRMILIMNGSGGPDVYASRDYPGPMIAQAAERARSRSTGPFVALLPERDATALEAAIGQGGALIWVRSRDPDMTNRVVSLLLRRSTQRVRTFIHQPEGKP